MGKSWPRPGEDDQDLPQASGKSWHWGGCWSSWAITVFGVSGGTGGMGINHPYGPYGLIVGMPPIKLVFIIGDGG